MSSIHEVFDRIEKWKTSETLLQVTVRGVGNDLQVLRCTISSSDRDAGHLGIVFNTRESATFDISGADFRIGKHAVEASHTGQVLLVFEGIEEPKQDNEPRHHIN